MSDASPTELPLAKVEPPNRWLPNLVWLIPVTAVIVGVWLGVHTLLEKGHTITISFHNAEGIEAGKTHVKYKSVDIGMVKRMALSADRTAALVTVELDKQAGAFLASDTRFWVVRPRIAAGEISGLGTLLSGSYIGVDIGKSEVTSHDFTGLEVPPIVTGDLPGRQFSLHANDLGSLDIGTPIYFRRVEVGEVVAYNLDADGRGVTLKIFVHAPYDKYVTEHSRFWHASGVDVAIDGAGIRVDTQSLTSVLVGGIAFESMPGESSGEVAAAGRTFELLPNRAQAMKRPDGESNSFLLYFPQSVRGLSLGAPVDFRGVVIGEVADVGVDFDPKALDYRFPVEVRIYPDRLRSRYRSAANSKDKINLHQLMDHLVGKGLRAQLRSDSLVTGQLYVAMDFFPSAVPATLNWNKLPAELPTISGGFDDLQATVLSIAHKIDHMPLEQIGGDVAATVRTLNTTLADIDRLVQHSDRELVPEAKAALSDARKTLGAAEQSLSGDSPLQMDTRQAMQEMARAARSLRTLADLLERDPQVLIRGRGDPPAPEEKKP
ncbi:MAG: MCE family protein [Burkholderiales bacterium]|nr:MCE family protein [Burkholderiales bacterium]